MLHTWGSVPGGGLSLDNARWVAARANFLVHVNLLTRLFQGKMLAMLIHAHDAGELKFFNTHSGLADKATFKRFIAPLRHTKWVVYCRQATKRRPHWLHEVKYDGYRLGLERESDRVRLITRGGHNWTDRYPLIVESALKNRHKRFVIDGEAVLLAFTGISDFDGLHSRRHDEEAQLYAFDILAMDGDDLRKLPLSMRKSSRACSSARPGGGIFAASFEQGELVPTCSRGVQLGT